MIVDSATLLFFGSVEPAQRPVKRAKPKRPDRIMPRQSMAEKKGKAISRFEEPFF
jgi:hypothetical protein